MSRTARTLNFEQDRSNVVGLIERHAAAGKPCPTRREILGVTDLPRREVWPVLRALALEGSIELEEKLDGSGNTWRRLRVAGGAWTGWTERRPKSREDAVLRHKAIDGQM